MVERQKVVVMFLSIYMDIIQFFFSAWEEGKDRNTFKSPIKPVIWWSVLNETFISVDKTQSFKYANLKIKDV